MMYTQQWRTMKLLAFLLTGLSTASNGFFQALVIMLLLTSRRLESGHQLYTGVLVRNKPYSHSHHHHHHHQDHVITINFIPFVFRKLIAIEMVMS